MVVVGSMTGECVEMSVPRWWSPSARMAGWESVSEVRVD